MGHGQTVPPRALTGTQSYISISFHPTSLPPLSATMIPNHVASDETPYPYVQGYSGCPPVPGMRQPPPLLNTLSINPRFLEYISTGLPPQGNEYTSTELPLQDVEYTSTELPIQDIEYTSTELPLQDGEYTITEQPLQDNEYINIGPPLQDNEYTSTEPPPQDDALQSSPLVHEDEYCQHPSPDPSTSTSCGIWMGYPGGEPSGSVPSPSTPTVGNMVSAPTR